MCVNDLLQTWAIAVHEYFTGCLDVPAWIAVQYNVDIDYEQYREPECCISDSWVFMSCFGIDMSVIRDGLTLLVSNFVLSGINFFEVNTEEKQSRWQSN